MPILNIFLLTHTRPIGVARKGKIIVLEGTDKAGKTTQSRMLVEALKGAGKICVVVDFPDYTTPIGMEIRAFLDGKRDYPPEVKHLLFSANRWEKKEEIEAMLENDTIVILYSGKRCLWIEESRGRNGQRAKGQTQSGEELRRKRREVARTKVKQSAH